MERPRRLIAQSAGPQRIGRALAVVGVPILLGPIFGPIIGGLIVDNAAWQWIFVVNVPPGHWASPLAPRTGNSDLEVLKPAVPRWARLRGRGGKHLDVGNCIVFGLKDGRVVDGREHFKDL